MAVMNPNDWVEYRTEARKQSANANEMPFVLDPSRATSDRAINQQTLYGNPGNPTGASTEANNPNALRQTIGQAFQQFFGRPATEQDYSAWMSSAQANGATPDAVTAGIAAAAKDPANASVIGRSPPGAGFSGGLMGMGGAGFSGLTGR